MSRINIDEIVRKSGSWKNMKDVFQAGRMAVKRINFYFEKGESFNQETTLCGHSILENIQKAKENGYCVELYYYSGHNNSLSF